MAAVSLVKFIYQWVLFNGLIEPVIAPSTTEPTLTVTTAQPKCSFYKEIQCRDIPAGCANCTFNSSCIYGDQTTINCTALDSVNCWGQRTFSKNITCRYCYQLPNDHHICVGTKTCKTQSGPHQKMLVQCGVQDNTYCLGTRSFRKSVPCNWSSGYRWSTAILLSITLGGFGVDRFYLGHWQAGLGKVFSFGGLGAWTLVDIILIAVGYVGPADGSLFIF